MWFREESQLWPGQSFSLETTRCIEDIRSRYQHIQVFETATYGRLLVLDGCIQLTERDEFSYHEMMAHTGVFGMGGEARTVLVIGGGDGGVVRELCKHASVEEIHLCDLDEEVIRVSKEYFPKVASGLSDSRVTIHVEDGAEYMARHSNKFDLIIVDSSDPIGPAETLFGADFKTACHKALNSRGVLIQQGECMWLHLELIKTMLVQSRELFDSALYSWHSIPTYPCGTIGLAVAVKGDLDVKQPKSFKGSSSVLLETRYYTEDIHKASFMLPKFVADALI